MVNWLLGPRFCGGKEANNFLRKLGFEVWNRNQQIQAMLQLKALDSDVVKMQQDFKEAVDENGKGK